MTVLSCRDTVLASAALCAARAFTAASRACVDADPLLPPPSAATSDAPGLRGLAEEAPAAAAWGAGAQKERRQQSCGALLPPPGGAGGGEASPGSPKVERGKAKQAQAEGFSGCSTQEGREAGTQRAVKVMAPYLQLQPASSASKPGRSESSGEEEREGIEGNEGRGWGGGGGGGVRRRGGRGGGKEGGWKG